MSYYSFTKEKFLAQPCQRQHRRCAELLGALYRQILAGEETNSLVSEYNVLCSWIQIEPMEQGTLETISNRYHDHLFKAQQSLKEHNLLPAVRKSDREKSSNHLPVNIYLNRLRSAHNIGSILRTTEAFALGTVYFSEGMANSQNKQVQDAAMGTAERLVTKSCRCITDLPGPVIALETSPQAISLTEFIFPSSFTLVLGNEEYGCSEEILRRADYLIEIPLYGWKNSLNVANAYAIAAAEISQQLRRR